jgi:poly-gamma-glutamate capsule biosynthesis protein CapA/YwtB (metallophosphatase superfamily)
MRPARHARRVPPALRRLAAAVAGVSLLAGCSPGSGEAPAATAGLAGAPPASSSPSAPSASAPSASAGTGPRTLSLVATGDVLLHEPLWEQARRDAGASPSRGSRMDFAPMLAAIRPVVSGADLALCHLETPLAPPAGPYDAYPSFASPPQVLTALKATGYDACTTASNHTFDKGGAGVDRTLDELDEAGIAHTGSYRTEAESRRTTIVTAAGVKVAILSYTYGFNGSSFPGGDEWRANVIDEDRVLADAKVARKRGAEVVVVALHWGTEYEHDPNGLQRDLAPRLARSRDVDLIVGHHAHVVQPVERIGRTWVVYGLGNLLAWHTTPVPANAEGLLVRFTFTEGDGGRFAVTKAEYDPLLVARDTPVRLLDVRAALASSSYGSSTASRLRTALTRTTRVVTSRGATKSGLVPLSTP